MTDENIGSGAEVGAKKIDGEGNIAETRGVADDTKSRSSWIIFYVLVILSIFGLWKVVELFLTII